jgi:hypothetical protein
MLYENDDSEYYPEDDYENDSAIDKYKHYFKFDADAWDAWGKFLYDTLNDVVEQSPNTWYVYGFPVNGYFSNTVSGSSSLLYLGNNQHNENIWKSKNFIIDSLKIEYVLHLQSHARYFICQPQYYKGLFEILN